MVTKKATAANDDPKDTSEYNAELIEAQKQETAKLNQEAEQHIELISLIQKEEIFGVLFPVFLQFQKSRIIKALNDSSSFSIEIDDVNDELINIINSLQRYWSDEGYQLDDQRFWLQIYLGFASLRLGAIETALLYGQSSLGILNWLFDATKAEYKRVKSLI
jgi:hypothetical protein